MTGIQTSYFKKSKFIISLTFGMEWVHYGLMLKKQEQGYKCDNVQRIL